VATKIEKLLKLIREGKKVYKTLEDEISCVSNFEMNKETLVLKSLEILLKDVEKSFLSVDKIISIEVAVENISEKFDYELTHTSRLDYQSFSFYKRRETYPWDWKCVLTVDYLPLKRTLYFSLDIKEYEQNEVLNIIKEVTTAIYRSMKIK